MTIGVLAIMPEIGWKRYDDNDAAIKYTNLPLDPPNSVFHESTIHYKFVADNVKVEFLFTGKKLRIISSLSPNYSQLFNTISIDGVDYSYRQYDRSKEGQKYIVYEIEGLNEGIHSVVITSPNGVPFGIDAIDIDAAGRILHVKEKTNVSDMVVGDRVRCNYRADAGSVGFFGSMGVETSKFIQSSSNATPNGDFYFIHVDNDHKGRKILVADRNIQNAITWVALNEAGVSTKSGRDFRYDPVGVMNSYENERILVEDNGYESGSYGSYYGWKVFDSKNGDGDKWARNFNGPAELKIHFKKGKERIVALAMTKPPAVSATDAQVPKHFQLVGSNDGQVWDVIFEHQTGLSQSQVRFSFKNENAYSMYKIIVLSSNSTVSQIGELKFEARPIDTDYSLRLLTGGASEAYKSDSEWNQYIVSGPYQGDDSVWNWSSMRSLTSTTTTSGSHYRTVRGMNSVDDGYYVSSANSTNVTASGFRPVLSVEPFEIPKETRFLITKEGNILTQLINQSSGEKEWITLPETELTEELFLTHGMTDLSSISEPAWAELGGDFEILCYKEEASPLQVKVTTETLYDEANKRYAGTGVAKVDEIELPIGATGFMIHELSEGTTFTVNYDGIDLGEKEPGVLHTIEGGKKLELYAHLESGSLDAVALLWL